jgi:ankyrin repeat protein
MAAFSGKLSAVLLLALLNTDLNHKDEKGMTPLHHAALLGNEETVSYLLHKNVEVNSKNMEGRTPLHLSGKNQLCRHRLTSDLAKNNEFGCAQLLLEKGADVNIKDSNGQTCLDLATHNRSKEVIALLSSFVSNRKVRYFSSGFNIIKESWRSEEVVEERQGSMAELEEKMKSYELEPAPILPSSNVSISIPSVSTRSQNAFVWSPIGIDLK